MSEMGDEWQSEGKWLVSLVPDYDEVTGGNQTSLERLGAPYPAAENNLLASLPSDWKASDGSTVRSRLQNSQGFARPGWLEYTDGDRTVVTVGTRREAVAGSREEYIQGDVTTEITGNETITIGGTKVENIAQNYRLNIGAGTLEVYNADPIYKVEFFEQPGVIAAGKPTWRKREMGHNSSDTYTFGDVESFFGGYKFDATFGLTNGIFVGGKIDLGVAASFAANVGFALEFGAGLKYSNVAGKDLNVAGDHELKARSSIHLRIKADHEGVGVTRNKILAVLAAAGGTVVAASLAAGTAGGGVNADGVAPAPAACLGVAAGFFAAGLAAAVFLALRDKAAAPISQTELKLDDTSVLLQQNDAAGVMQGLVKLGPAAGLISLKNALNSWLQLQRDGDIVANAGQNLILQTQSASSILKLLSTGEIRIKSTMANIQGGRLDFNNGALRVV